MTETAREPARQAATGLEVEPEAASDATGDARDPSHDALRHVVERVRLRATQRIAWLRHLWTEGIEADADASGNVLATTSHEEVDALLAGRDEPAAQARFLKAACEAADDQQAERARTLAVRLHAVEQWLASDAESRLADLIMLFELTPEEIDVLHACLAVALEPSLRRVYAYLHDDARRPWTSEELVQRLFDHERPLGLGPGCALRAWSIIEYLPPDQPEDPRPIRCDRWVLDWLQGKHGIDAQLMGRAQHVDPLPPLEGWPVRGLAERIRRLAGPAVGSRVCVRVVGPRGSGRHTFAACVARELGLDAIAVRSGDEPESWHAIYRRAQRQAFLDRAALIWSGRLADAQLPEHILAVPVQFHVCEPGAEARTAGAFVELSVHMPHPGLQERRRLWPALVPAASSWSGESLERLATDHRVWVGDIAAVAAHAVQRPEMASAVLRERARQRIGDLAEHLPSSFRRDDLVLPAHLDQSLDELVFEARERARFWEQDAARRLFPQGRGLLALLTGPPGTGKTMAAQVVANTVGVDLFRVNLSGIVSKYVGETSKNIQRILSQAAPTDVALLFDEGDALFGSRTEVKDANDRHANETTAHLLQAIESYPGLAMLTTNRRADIDAAFVRRLRYVLEFPRPQAPQRLAIWQRLVQELAGSAALSDVGDQVEVLAEQVELSGAQIKYAVLTALFVARAEDAPLSPLHLLRGVQRELEKEGRGLSHRERERLLARVH